MNSKKIRLDRFLSNFTSLSRTQAQKAIRNGQVGVGGQVIRDPGMNVAIGSAVTWQGEAVQRSLPRYFMLYKPAGYICATRDDKQPTAMTLLREPFPERLHFAGRLDMDTTGLLLVTDDGDWSHRVTSPRWKCPKQYLAVLDEPLGEAAKTRLETGILLRNEEKPTRPATIETLPDRRVRIIVWEGRYHQVKRMFAAVGNRVLALHRESIGAIRLDPALVPGEYRSLSNREIESVCPVDAGLRVEVDPGEPVTGDSGH